MINKSYLSILFVTIISLFLIAFNSSATTWTTETDSTSKRFSQFYSRAFAVDSVDNPHIVYGGRHLYNAFYDGICWNYETVDSSSGVGGYASIALDSSGKAHISKKYFT